MPSSRQVSDTSTFKRQLRPLLVSLCIGVLVSTIILLAFSGVLSVGTIPQSAVGPMAIFAGVAGAFAAGFSGGKMRREKGMLTGGICGALLAAIVLLASFAISDNGFGLLAFIKVLLLLLASMLGGIMGVNHRPRRK